MHLLLVGHNTARDPLVAIARYVRGRGNLVSCFFNKYLDCVNAERGFPRTDFLILGLCAQSRDKDSPEFAVEQDVIVRATGLGIPCGIICDEFGNVSAPYLIEVSSKIRLVVAHAQNPACNATDIYENALPLYLSDVAVGGAAIADALSTILRLKHRARA